MPVARIPSRTQRIVGCEARAFILENLLSSFVVLFGTTTLVATALLFVLQMFEDIRNA